MLENKEASKIQDELVDILEKIYEEKMANFSKEDREEIEKLIYLQTLDKLWREHLYEMDTLKTGIGLRGYNQKDPLTEYKQESFRLFEDLIRKIKTESVQFIHRVDLSAQEEQQTAQNEEEYLNETDLLNDIAHQEAIEEDDSDITLNKKPKRNDPCPCGSGKKYKNCCGKSGPKKGLLA